MRIYHFTAITVVLAFLAAGTPSGAQELGVGASDRLEKGEFDTFPELNLNNMLQGRISGLQVRSIVHGLGNNTADLYVRGQHGMTANTALVIIDGVERPMADLIPEEIESIEVLKDATAKILYGARAANGVVVITTRKGRAGEERNYRVSAEMGITTMTRMPEWLDSWQYATLYNEACLNDGLSPYYSQSHLEGYRNSSGAFDTRYPNIDWQKEFLSSTSNFRKVSFEMSGGSEKVKYALVAGYVGGSGYEKGIYTPQLNRINLRGNLEFNVTDFLSVVAGVSGRMEMRKWGQMNCAQMFSAASTYRPNEYSFILDGEETGLAASEDVPLFGGSILRSTNVYSEMYYGGYTDERYTRAQTDFGVKFDLDKKVKGLKAGAYLSFDNYDYLQLSLAKKYPVYAPASYTGASGETVTDYIQVQKINVATDQTRNSTTLQQTLGWNAYAGYDRNFGKNAFSADLRYQFNKTSSQGVSQDIINSVSSLSLGWAFDRRYVLEADAALMGSNRFQKGNKLFLSAAGGASWVISNEPFLRGNRNVNLLKLKVSGGLLGYDSATSHLLYERDWEQSGSFNFGTTANGATAFITNFIKDANPDLRWEKAVEINVGLEAAFLGDRLSFEADWFREKHYDIIGLNDATYGGYTGDFVTYANMGSVLNEGVEAQARWQDKAGDFSYSIGANVLWSRNKVLEWNQVLHGENYRYVVGNSTSAMTGYVAEGLFGRDIAIDGHPSQSFGHYQDGDIAYRDINGDGLVDGRDVTVLGNSFPEVTLGFDIDLRYKGWGLYAVFYAELGVDAWMNNAYYWNYGENAYSVLALDRWHPVNNPQGTYPRLTTTDDMNNWQNSTFWLQKTDWLRLKNLELSYTFSRFNVRNLSGIKVFLRGTNLFTVSPMKDLDPELPNAGLTNYPVGRTFTCGVAFTL
ncbi:MAG: SusC/RagA family TonB-linked outer membrane protein [Candidatus Cryptobacteroides sp.]